MTANALVTTRVDESIKQEAAQVLATMGLTVSDAVRLMLTKIAREHRFPFELREPNAETVQAMLEARKGQLKAFNSIDDLMADLHEKD
ncbi:MAG: type II toxin-antitoxin system RelB/DinJ family antitoxin [Thiofilum sp.]|uniref:type II toxin-antitoxin system RelB/DinJ family antitoxin n=1 Tax=Thiofilum sp. TaxID=2212733 RepID=UPI0025E93D11|nr:type II toxin-antitoxin system RelB/DinJ family antitoxin [Thiofilum sp.]MBK8453621.1 type II toxin-antitoxin system RelB/DinJ family antitoxin [Thiofilum sp.]